MFDFFALLPLGKVQLKFEMGKNSQQWVINFMRCTERELRQRCVLFVLCQLRLKLTFLFVELAFVREPAKQFLHGHVSLSLQLLDYRLGLFQLVGEALAVPLIDSAECDH